MIALLSNFLNSFKANKCSAIIEDVNRNTSGQQTYMEKIEIILAVIGNLLPHHPNPDLVFLSTLLPFYNKISNLKLFLTIN